MSHVHTTREAVGAVAAATAAEQGGPRHTRGRVLCATVRCAFQARLTREAVEMVFAEGGGGNTAVAGIGTMHMAESSELATPKSAADSEAGRGAAAEFHAAGVLVGTQVMPLPQLADVPLQSKDNLPRKVSERKMLGGLFY